MIPITHRLVMSFACFALAACNDFSTSSTEGVGAGSADDNFTYGSKKEGEACNLHSECERGTWCAFSGTCSSKIKFPDADCRGNADCEAGEVCFYLEAKCYAGQCGHDLDCPSKHCATTETTTGTPFQCVDCEADKECASGKCTQGRCAQ